ncbi:chondroitin sulfate proteoglycan 4 [Callorhinchus milii]|uniref:chondroitin sulfate proteoglycan 4 n=1 Tax=Callorhinchus milii TaxID=7868 RepID=UPI001C3F7E25|nr:chondroitin sulfate proteoglycan 4 [Callorhinchus milii]
MYPPGLPSPGLLCCLLVSAVRLVWGASFWGESYVELKTVEASSKTSFRLRFLTIKSNGLLFLAAGQTDFWLVELQSGHVQVKLEFGSGERSLRSDRGLRLDDLAWHTLEIHHERENVTLRMDGQFTSSVNMPGPSRELNLQHGLFVGGIGGFDKPYLDGAASNFRGCIDEVVFNQHDILSSLRSYSGFKNVHEVSAGCSNQFFAEDDSPISLFSSKAYLAFPSWNAQAEGLFECAVRTTASLGLLLYSSGRQGDFVAMEIGEGLIRVVVGKTGRKTRLSSLSEVNDNNWHSVKLRFTSRHLYLTVDEEMVKVTLSPRNKILKLKGPLFVGGIDDSTRAEVVEIGLMSLAGRKVRGGSFRGCIQDVSANSETKSLKNVLVTKDISAGCASAKESPTTLIATTPEKTVIPTTAIPTTFTTLTTVKPTEKTQTSNFLTLQNLVVAEGGRAALESKHIKLKLDFKKLGVRQSQIIFKITKQPTHGKLKLDVSSEREQNSFTMLDLWHGRALYVHDGSEGSHDQFSFAIFTSSKKAAPAYLRGEEQYQFNITVTPTNDPPQLVLPKGNLFVLLENSKKLLTADVIKAVDVDTDSAALQFSVLGNLNADAGYLENAKNPGKRITVFSNAELEMGNVFYVHNGIRTSRIVLRVNDSDSVSNTVVLRIMAVPVDYKVVNMTGLSVQQGDVVLITNYNLSVQTNAVGQEVDIRYDITEAPKYGHIQRLHSSGDWKQTSSFSQRSIERNRVRYISTFREPQSHKANDKFRFKVSVGNEVSKELVFPIVVKWINFRLLKNNRLEIDKVKKQALDSDHLYAMIEGARVSESGLHYKLVSTPEKGHLLLQGEILKKNSSFSQKDVSAHKVEYELIEKPLEDGEDSFSFQLSFKQAVSIIHGFHILIKADVNSIILTNRGLTVAEGEGKLITQAELYAETLNTKTFLYTIIQSPKSGKLKRINRSDSADSNDNITTFTNQDIIGERLMYVHDDSESTRDEFRFIASAGGSTDNSEADSFDLNSVVGTFLISIELKNDEKPVRTVDKVFRVVRNSQRLLTTEDLCYHDPDSDFNDAQLLYTRRGIPNGDLVLINDTSKKLFQFHQEDLEQKRVLFTHQGADSARFVLFVTDGKHYTSSLLEVYASDPYIQIANNTGLLVQKGQGRSLTAANLSVTTNHFIKEETEIVYRLFLSPKHGGLYLNDVIVESFTQHDLKNGHVVYQHDNSNNLLDEFNFTVRVKNVLLDGGVSIRIYLESHQHPPSIVNNSSILVEEGKPVKISQNNLQIVHQDNLPTEIVYKVKIAPSHGYIRICVEEEGYCTGAEHKSIQAFTQQDINDGSVQYVQVKANKLKDSFTADVTNGVVKLTGISVLIDIIPRVIPIQIQNFTIKEGAAKALTENIIKISSQHFAGLNLEYSIIEQPKHGYVENSHFPGISLVSFTRQQVEQEFIYYVHDDSETLSDNFSIIVNDTTLRKQSLLRTIFVNITSLNDEAPVITTNKIFQVWVGSVTEITKDDLNADDKDSSPQELVYSVTPPSNGQLALKSSPNKQIFNFTQEHINNEQLVFVHAGAMSGGFNFQVTDGLNFAPRQIFSITARALVLSIETSQGFGVFPGTLKPIRSEHLKAVTNDDNTSNRTVIFTVVDAPKLGKLVKIKAGNMTHEVTSFTQDMVEKGLIAYEHMQTEAADWSVEDSFQFTVSSPPASLEPHVFHISISYDNTGPERHSLLVANTGAIVTEGERTQIDKSKLDASNLMVKLPVSQRSAYEVWYQVASLPTHGVIVVGERNITKQKPNFSQFIINKYGITYVHDNSESLRDNFTFAAWLNLKSKPALRPLNDSGVVEEMFNITIIPINDQAPELKTKAPILRVVQGYNAQFSTDIINVVDLDNPPEEINYTIISGPNNGFVAMAESLNVSIKHFTQANINNGNIWFVQDGSSSSGVFYFSVTDGKHRPLYKLFNLEVIPITIMLVNNTHLAVLQGQSIFTVTNKHLAAETNGKSTVISYQITSPPQFGHVSIGNRTVTLFDQEDLVQSRVVYHMTDLSVSQDSFEFTVMTSEGNATAQVVNITVKPLIKMAEDLKIPTRTTFQFGRDVLDASELANQTGSVPVFEVKQLPTYGTFVKLAHAFRGRREAAITFTQKDIELGLVLLEVNANMTGIDVLIDSFTFVLTADSVQPAEAMLVYSIVPFNASLVQNITIPENPLVSSSNATSELPKSGELPLEIQTEVPTQTTAKIKPWWQKKSRWGSDKSNTSISAPDMTLASIVQQTIIEPLNGKPVAQPIKNSDSLSIILPFVVVAFVLIIIIGVTLFVKRQKKKHKPLINNCPNNGASSAPSFQPTERSMTVPTVTVTRLDKGPSSPSPMERHTQMSTTASESKQTSTLLYNCNSIDPDMVQHCRTTNPTLRQNQYWV